MRDGGKGDKQRPLGISQSEFDKAWDRIFKEKDGSLTANVNGGEINLGETNEQKRQKTTETND